MAKTTVEVVGLQQYEKVLDQLAKKDANKIVRRSQRAAAKAMLKETKALAPVDTGLLRKSLAVRALKRKRGRIGFYVGYKNVDEIVAKSATKSGKRYFYPAAVEYGTTKNPPHPFMRPAFDAHKDEAIKIIIDSVSKDIVDAIKKKNSI